MKRFYSSVDVAQAGDGWQVTLDGRGIKTQGGEPQVVPSHDLALTLAQEWASQPEKIDTGLFRLRDHADYAIDIIRPNRDEAIDKLLSYAETDTLCYRADPDEALHKRQQEAWEPLLGHLESRHGVSFNRISGVIHKPQPPETLRCLREYLAAQDDFTLAALTAMASLAASLSVALLGIDEAINDPEPLWRDANLEEEWQAEMWGRDAEAEAARARRWEAFSAAATFAALARTA